MPHRLNLGNVRHRMAFLQRRNRPRQRRLVVQNFFRHGHGRIGRNRHLQCRLVRPNPLHTSLGNATVSVGFNQLTISFYKLELDGRTAAI